MKLKIKYKRVSNGDDKVSPLQIINNGDWIDLSTLKDETLQQNVLSKLSLGIAMQLPKGYEAIVASRSSSPFKYNIIIPNGIGIIDNSYNGDNDVWCYVAYSIKDVVIPKGTRIAQFRIQLSQKATPWQKILNLFYNGIEFIEVPKLYNDNRGGFGSTN